MATAAALLTNSVPGIEKHCGSADNQERFSAAQRCTRVDRIKATRLRPNFCETTLFCFCWDAVGSSINVLGRGRRLDKRGAPGITRRGAAGLSSGRLYLDSRVLGLR